VIELRLFCIEVRVCCSVAIEDCMDDSADASDPPVTVTVTDAAVVVMVVVTVCVPEAPEAVLEVVLEPPYVKVVVLVAVLPCAPQVPLTV
jgi:hypothetical protein